MKSNYEVPNLKNNDVKSVQQHNTVLETQRKYLNPIVSRNVIDVRKSSDFDLLPDVLFWQQK